MHLRIEGNRLDFPFSHVSFLHFSQAFSKNHAQRKHYCRIKSHKSRASCIYCLPSISNFVFFSRWILAQFNKQIYWDNDGDSLNTRKSRKRKINNLHSKSHGQVMAIIDLSKTKLTVIIESSLTADSNRSSSQRTEASGAGFASPVISSNIWSRLQEKKKKGDSSQIIKLWHNL